MYLLGALTVFLAAAEATVSSDAIVQKLTFFKYSAIWLQNPARFITPLDAVLDDFKTGPAFICIKGLKDAANDATRFASHLGGASTYAGKEADDIYHAYAGFVGEHVKLFDILTESSKRFAVPSPHLGQAMYGALADVQGIANAFNGFLKGAVPTMAPQFASQEGLINPALATCLNSWNWVCSECCKSPPGTQGPKCSTPPGFPWFPRQPGFPGKPPGFPGKPPSIPGKPVEGGPY